MSPNSRCSNLGHCQPRAVIMSSLTLTYLADKGTDNGNYIPFQSIQEALCVDTHRNIIYSIFMGKVKVCDRPEDSFTSQIDNMRKAAVWVVRWSCTAVHCARHHDTLECSENQLGLHEGWVLFLAHSQIRKPGSNGLSLPWMASSLDLTKCPLWMRSCQANPIAACNQAWSTTHIWRLHTCIASTNWSK